MTSISKRKKATVRFSAKLIKEMQKHIIHLGYGLHGKSKWVSEAIRAFVALPNYIELVVHGININQGELIKTQAFYLDTEMDTLLRESILDVRKELPLLEGVQSAIIRASVINRLIDVNYNKIVTGTK